MDEKNSKKKILILMLVVVTVLFLFVGINNSTYSIGTSGAYSLTLVGNGGTLVSSGEFSDANGKTIWNGNVDGFMYDSVLAINSSKKFIGWDESKECDSPKRSGSIGLNKDLTLYACWGELNEYIVTLNPNGGTLKSSLYPDMDGMTTNWSKYMSTFNYYAATALKNGYVFDGWDTTNKCFYPKTEGSLPLKEDTTLYACWKEPDEEKEYTITLNPNGGTLRSSLYPDMDGMTTNWSKVINVYHYNYGTAEKSGYTFTGWDTSNQCSNPQKDGMLILKGNTTLYACFKKNTSGGDGGSSKPIINCSSNSIGYGCNDSNTNGGVSNLQTKLKYLGFYSGEVDGNVGPQTVTAIKNFQKNEGLTVDGNAGPATLERLRLKYNEKIQDNNDDETPKDEEEIPVNPLSYYTLKYDTNGGSFANGESIRTIIVSNEAIVEAPPYNPTREGYIFDEWYTSGGQKFTFYEHLTSDVTLVAKWTKIETVDECTYSCNDGDVYDPLDNKCISIQKFNNEKNLMSIVNYNKVCSNGISKFSDYNCTGNCNKEDCASDYNTNFWYEKNTCHFGGSCSDGDDSSCSITMKKECYKTYEPNKDCQNSNEDSKEDNNVSNPSTGSMFLIIVLIVGIGSLVYSIYYYNKNKKKAN